MYPVWGRKDYHDTLPPSRESTSGVSPPDLGEHDWKVGGGAQETVARAPGEVDSHIQLNQISCHWVLTPLFIVWSET